MSPSNGALPTEVPDWCQIADRAAKESDPKKLVQLVRALCDRLQEAELRKRKRPHLDAASGSDGNSARPPAA